MSCADFMRDVLLLLAGATGRHSSGASSGASSGRALAAAACAQRSAAAVRACSSGATSAEAERSCGSRAPLSSHGRWVRLPALTSCVEFQPAGLSDCYAPLSLAVHSFFYGAPLAGKACSTLEGEVRICKTAR